MKRKKDYHKLGNILTISSHKNDLIKYIKKLLLKKYRNIRNHFIAEGEFFLKEAISNEWKII